MNLLDYLRDNIPPLHPLRLLYYRIIAMLAAIFYRFPSRHLKVIAVTGTKGKSTVVHLIAHILQTAGHRIGVASTIHFQIGDAVFPNMTKQTTQGRFALQKLLRKMADAACEYAVLEVTSHALVQSRLWGVKVDVAVLTNIDRDHIEYHGNFEKYREAKAMLFKSLQRGTAVLPADDPEISFFEKISASAVRKITYGIASGDVAVENVICSPDGCHFSFIALRAAPQGIPVHLKLLGEFNVRNALAAAASALACGVPAPIIQKALESEIKIPGRLEMIHAGQQFTVVVDYAHTPDSLEKLLSLFRPLTKGKLWIVFGATGGGRDKAKRPEMGHVASRYADNIVVTDDDPYTEDRMQIIEQIISGIPRKQGDGLWKILERREAISFALSHAQPYDTVLIAGKGCEPIQIIGRERIAWDDREVVRGILKKMPNE